MLTNESVSEVRMDRKVLIAAFVNDWGYPDAVANEYFLLDLERLISKICPEPSIESRPFTVPIPDLKPKRMIRV